MSFLNNVIAGIDNTNIIATGENSSEFSGSIDTGSYILNAAMSGSLYGGVPNNKITAFAGESATGKTFFVLGVLKKFLDDGHHDQVIIPNPGYHAAAFGARIDGYMFADHIILANDQP